MPAARAFLRDDRQLIFLLFVLVGGFALGCLLTLAFVDAAPLGSLGTGGVSGVVGWVTVHHYPKRQEALYYAFGVLLATALPFVAVWAWLRVSVAIARALGADLTGTLRLGAVSFLPAVAGLLHAMLYRPGQGVIAATVLAMAGSWTLLGVARWVVTPPRGRHSMPRPVVDHPVTVLTHRALVPGVAVLLAGAVFAWFLPLVVSGMVARALARSWGLASLAFGLVWLAAFRRLRQQTGLPAAEVTAAAALPFLPFFLMLAVPFVLGSLGMPFALLGTAVALGVAGFAILLYEPLRRRVLPPWTGRIVRHAPGLVLVAALALLGALWASSPGFPGITVSALDGDHLLAWLNEGRHGKLPYRDFWYPYGPLFFYFDLLWVRAAGLDRYVVPVGMAAAALSVLVLAATVRCVFLTWPAALLASVYAFFVYGNSPVALRVYLAYSAMVATVAAARRPGIWPLGFAGALAALSWLWSHEAALAALVGGQAALLWDAVMGRSTGRLREIRRRMLPFFVGFLALLLPAVVAGGFLGMLPGYVRSTFGFARILDDCCGLPFPSLFSELPPSPSLMDLFHRFRSVPVRSFYLPPLIYVSTAIYLLAASVRGRRGLSSQDVQLAGLTIFGLLLYRVALGRSGSGHAAFAALPAWILLFALIERVGHRLGRTLFGFLHAATRRASLTGVTVPALETLVLGAVLVFYVDSLSLSASLLPPLQTAHRKLTRYYRFTRMPAVSTRTAVRGHDDGLYLFGHEGVARMVRSTMAYLDTHTTPGEGVFAFPYAFRYNFLLDRSTPVRFGPCLWAAAATLADQARLVTELQAVRPRYIVYDESEWPNADGVPWTDRFPEVTDFIFAQYRLEAQVEATSILRYADGDVPLPPSILDLGAASSRLSLRRGWYYPEEFGGRIARWTTTVARAQATRRRGEDELFVDVLGMRTLGAGRQLMVLLDGAEVGKVALPQDDRWITFRFPVPETAAIERPLTVALLVDRPYTIDMRPLGLVVQRVGFR